MLPPDLYRLVESYLTQPLRIGAIDSTSLFHPSAALACVNHEAHQLFGYQPLVETTRVYVTGPDLLFKNWLRLDEIVHCPVMVGDSLGCILLRLLKQWRLPAHFFSCDLDMWAPPPATVHLSVNLGIHELIIIIDDYLRYPYEQYICKLLKQNYTAELHKIYAHSCILLRDSFDGQVLLLDAV
jgi:hypothetical protein